MRKWKGGEGMNRVRKAGKALKENRIVILGFILVVFDP